MNDLERAHDLMLWELLPADTIRDMHVSKFELFPNIPSGIDFALPQQWLDDFATVATLMMPYEQRYELIRSTTCWDCRSNVPVFRCQEVHDAWERLNQ